MTARPDASPNASPDLPPAISPAATRAAMLRDGPILATLVRLSLPNLIALGSATIVSIAETAYVGTLGIAALGGVALVFPVFMLTQMLAAGAMGGTVSGAISRALGSGDEARARGLALAALAIALGLGSLLTVAVLALGPLAYATLGGNGAVLAAAIAYSNIAALAIPAIWITHMLASVARGAGTMAVPAMTLLVAGVVQVAVGGAFGLGLGPFPRLGMAGVALGLVAAFTTAALVLFMHLRSLSAPLRLVWTPGLLRASHVTTLLRVGTIAMLSPLLSVSTILVLTALVARFGPQALAGFGIGVRLEFLLIPIAFSVGVACVPMVGTAIGAGNVPRARRIAWTAGGLAAVSLALLGMVAALAPGLWVDLFTADPAVQTAAYAYLGIAGFSYGFFGLGSCLYFASQGAGRVGGAIAAQALRLALVLAGGWYLIASAAPLWTIFLLSALTMIPLGLGTALFIKLARW